MRLSEFASEADNIRYTKLIFDKALKALVARYKKRLKIHKNKQRMAKQQIKNNKIRALRNDTTIDVKKTRQTKKIKYFPYPYLI